MSEFIKNHTNQVFLLTEDMKDSLSRNYFNFTKFYKFSPLGDTFNILGEPNIHIEDIYSTDFTNETEIFFTAKDFKFIFIFVESNKLYMAIRKIPIGMPDYRVFEKQLLEYYHKLGSYKKAFDYLFF